MYRILVVDDEPIIADGLSEELTLLEDLDLQVIKTYSGRGALAILARHRIDIVVTDIKMPGMDGMALLERIRSSWPLCRVIFLTGYNEFDSVYQAIQYKDVQYALKSEGYERVFSAIRSAIEGIERELTLEALQDETNRRLEVASLFLQKDLLVDRLLQHDGAASFTEKDLRICRLELLREEDVLLVAGRVDSAGDCGGYCESIECIHSIRRISEHQLNPRLLVACVPDNQQDILLFLQPRALREKAQGIDPLGIWNDSILFLDETLEIIQASIRVSLGRTISWASASRQVAWEDISDSYGSVKRMLDLPIGVGMEMILHGDDPDMVGLFGTHENRQANRIESKLDLLSSLLRREERVAYFKELEPYLVKLDGTVARHDIPAMAIYASIAAMLLSYMARGFPRNRIPGTFDSARLMNVERFSSWQKAASFLRQMSEAVFDLQQTDPENRAEETANRLKSYIDKHIGDDLSLAKLSEYMHFNYSYLSRVFSHSCGETLREYIRGKQIEKAKKLLGTDRCNLSDIAVSVGFGSTSNFIRFFKNQTGMTPVEYIRETRPAG
jgi:two-component system response regulator YesN